MKERLYKTALIAKRVAGIREGTVVGVKLSEASVGSNNLVYEIYMDGIYQGNLPETYLKDFVL